MYATMPSFFCFVFPVLCSENALADMGETERVDIIEDSAAICGKRRGDRDSGL